MLKHKFKAKRTELNGIKFSSKLEAKYYSKLLELKNSGDILFFLMQVPFRLTGGIIYRLDFMEFWSDGNVILTEVKGFDTPQSIMKLKMVNDLFNVDIKVVRKV
jgi:hypothetical protein